MTDEQILELAKNCDFDFSIKWRLKGGGSSNQMYWKCYEEQLLKFARLMYDKGQEEETRRQKTGIGYVNDVLFVDEF